VRTPETQPPSTGLGNWSIDRRKRSIGQKGTLMIPDIGYPNNRSFSPITIALDAAPQAGVAQEVTP